MIFFRRLYRFTRVCLTFAYGMIELVIKRPHSRAARAAWLSVFCNRLLRATGVTFNTSGNVPMHGAVITNHLTYIDIIIHSAMRPCVFVSKAELRDTPVLGWVSMMAGTIYVHRGAGGSAVAAAEIMAKGFRDGLPVVFFPEGGTFVGDIPRDALQERPARASHGSAAAYYRRLHHLQAAARRPSPPARPRATTCIGERRALSRTSGTCSASSPSTASPPSPPSRSSSLRPPSPTARSPPPKPAPPSSPSADAPVPGAIAPSQQPTQPEPAETTLES